MNFLFWNIHKNANTFSHLINIIKEEKIDLIALAEFPEEANSSLQLVSLLNQVDNYSYLEPVNEAKEKVKIFFRTSRVNIANKFDGRQISVKWIKSSGYTISVIFCHLGSKINNDEHEQFSMAIDFKKQIEEFENYSNNEYTIVCGDFNMNPFETGMVDSKAFHAVIDKTIALRKSRIVNGENYKYFYNPMWGCLGDNGKGEYPGTHYFAQSKSMQYFWNIYDQIIVRPSVIPIFDDKKMKIVTKGQNYNLLKNNGKIETSISDHLPILFNLKI